MKLLITGGFGYLGGRLAQFLALQSDNEIILGSRVQTRPPLWLPQSKVVQIRWEYDVDLEKTCSGVDSIVHLAGMNAPDCAADPVAALEVNGLATARLLRAAIRQGVRRFVYASTAHVYSSPLAGVITEETCPTNPHPYATSHRAGEDVVRSAHQCKEIEGVVIRFSNTFGAPAHREANCWMLLVNDLCRQAVTTGKMVLHSFGTQRRDFVTLTDACRAIDHLLRLPAEKLGDGLFNVGGAWGPTILEMAQQVAEGVHSITGNRPEILRKEGQKNNGAESLDYRMERLANTSFDLGGSSHVSREIDGLIKFCIRHLKGYL